MDTELADPTDWHATRLPGFAPLDGALRCQVCKDFFTNAVITSCSHTFCSLCIRRCLAAEGKCPTCRASEQEVKLRRNVGVQEVTDAFVAARGDALKLAREGGAGEPVQRGAKRKREAVDEEPPSSQRRTRRQTREAASSQEAVNHATRTMVGDSESEGAESEYNPETGLVACPICKKRMKENLVNAHLDTCIGSQDPSPTPKPHPSRKTPTVPSKDTPPPDRLPQFNYSLYNENNLRKKLTALGIPTWGNKQLLMKRHTEWINLWNAECDSARPRPKAQLLRDLDSWERSQGGRAREGRDSAIMNKDFDGSGWAQKNKSEFDALIANARRKRKAPAESDQTSKTTGTEETKTNGLPARAESKTSDHIDFATPQKLSTPSSSHTSSTSSTNRRGRAPAGLPKHRDAISEPEGHVDDELTQGQPSLSRVKTTGSTASDISPVEPLPRRLSLAGLNVRQVPMFEVSARPVADTDP